MSDNPPLFCRLCQVPAEGRIVDGQVNLVQCPNCETVVSGIETVQGMIADQAKYLAASKFQGVLQSATKSGEAVKFTPTRLQDPGWPFVFRQDE